MSSYNPKRLSYFKKYMKKRRREQRQKAIKLLGDKCRCGNSTKLHFHRRDGKKHPAGVSLVLKHPERYILVCAKCHSNIHTANIKLESIGEKLENIKELEVAFRKLMDEYGDVIRQLGKD